MTAPDRIWTAPTDGKCHVGFDTKSMNYTIEYARVTPDTITLPRAEVEALMEAATAKTVMDANNSNSTYLDSACRRALAALQERMK